MRIVMKASYQLQPSQNEAPGQLGYRLPSPCTLAVSPAPFRAECRSL